MRFSPFLIAVALGLPMVDSPVTASAQLAIGISVGIAPPPLPIYVQPPLPAPGYIWTPGYWAYADAGGYYWVPGTWVQPPSVGLLWTPPWWGFAGGFYGFHAGYWGPHIGFYGGINYGFGYNGIGFVGGRWDHGAFAYNGAVNNFGGAHITNVYRETVVNNTTINRVSFNGGNGGVRAEPTPEQAAYEREQHFSPTAEQARHFQAAGSNPAFRATVNHGRPAVAATARPGQFSGQGVVGARVAGAHARPTPTAAGAGGPKAPPPPHARVAHAAAPHPAPHAAPPHEKGKEEHH